MLQVAFKVYLTCVASLIPNYYTVQNLTDFQCELIFASAHAICQERISHELGCIVDPESCEKLPKAQYECKGE